MLADEQVERILVVVAHPDDVDFGCGGTVAGWTAAGTDVSYLIITDGDAGGFDPDVPRDQMASIRQAEQRDAAACVGVTDVRFLGYPDGRLYVTHELRRDISRVIRQVRPHRVVTQPPERNYERIYASHPDHLAAGEATMCAVYPDARNQFAHPELLRDEGLGEWSVPEVWLMTVGGPDAHYVDVTDTFDKKLAALQSHASQTGHMEELEIMLRTWLGDNAARAGWEDGRLAEAFRVVPTA